jgi:hypothetical protein
MRVCQFAVVAGNEVYHGVLLTDGQCFQFLHSSVSDFGGSYLNNCSEGRVGFVLSFNNRIGNNIGCSMATWNVS